MESISQRNGLHKRHFDVLGELKLNINTFSNSIFLVRICNTASAVFFLFLLVRVIRSHSQERTYILENSLTTIPDMGSAAFKKNILSKAPTEKAINELLKALLDSRNLAPGQAPQVKQEQAQKTVRMLVEMKTYKDLCETPFLDRTRTYYKEQSAQLINKPLPAYLTDVCGGRGQKGVGWIGGRKEEDIELFGASISYSEIVRKPLARGKIFHVLLLDPGDQGPSEGVSLWLLHP
jgi:hypothetical protein